MMFKKVFHITLMVCIFSLCFYQSLCYADGGNQGDIDEIEKELNNRESISEQFKDEYNKIHGQVKDLISAYDSEDSSEYLQTMGTAVTALDRARANKLSHMDE